MRELYRHQRQLPRVSERPYLHQVPGQLLAAGEWHLRPLLFVRDGHLPGPGVRGVLPNGLPDLSHGLYDVLGGQRLHGLHGWILPERREMHPLLVMRQWHL